MARVEQQYRAIQRSLHVVINTQAGKAAAQATGIIVLLGQVRARRHPKRPVPGLSKKLVEGKRC